jgi:hypothetical protein
MRPVFHKLLANYLSDVPNGDSSEVARAARKENEANAFKILECDK